MLDESTLKGIKLPVASQILNSLDVLVLDTPGQDDARLLGLAVDDDRASAAAPVVAAILSAHQPQPVTQHLK
jgi:hypothetical protein